MGQITDESHGGYACVRATRSLTFERRSFVKATEEVMQWIDELLRIFEMTAKDRNIQTEVEY